MYILGYYAFQLAFKQPCLYIFLFYVACVHMYQETIVPLRFNVLFYELGPYRFLTDEMDLGNNYVLTLS